ncbi:MAG: hypothetical protein HY904_07860 [Deltaproteobacteria bacterium]|nr:hypothetical protein [Deltaproteobacteria bacterium]
MRTTFLASVALLVACDGHNGDAAPDDGTWDIDVRGVPTFMDASYVELDKIHRVSRFRSGIGHDYSDSFEHCRSMKHYFEPKAELDWSTVGVASPVTGEVTRVEPEWAGTKVEIQSAAFPAFRVVIFHVQLSSALAVGHTLQAGQALGHHVGAQTASDIAVLVNDPTRQGRFVSYFETLGDAVFGQFAARGVASRQDAIISAAERDADPLTCTGDAFADPGTVPNWIILD